MNSICQYSSKFTRRQCGFSLVEVMVALVISLFLIAGVIQLFIGSKQAYRFHEALSRIQENGRFALQAMTRDILMAGFQFPTPLPPSPAPPSPNNAVESTGNNITVRWSDPGAAPPQCTAVGGICTRSYSIAPSTSGIAGATSLFLQSDGGANQELVEGVEAMQILYGVCIDTDADNNIDTVSPPYRTAAQVAAGGAIGGVAGAVDWGNVCSVRIDLRLVSLEDNIVIATQTLVFPADTGNPFTPNPADRRLRQGFSTTVLIRNRLR